MKVRIARVRQFGEKHAPLLIYSSGVCTGIGVTILVAVKRPQLVCGNIQVVIDETPERLLEMMKSSGGLKITNGETGQKLRLITNAIMKD